MGQFTYLALLCGWALPVIFFQWAVGRDKLLKQRRVLVLGTLIPTVYLGLADVLAIRTGIWRFNPELTLDLWLGGLPLEEGAFFLLTNIMVVQGIMITRCA